MRYTSEQAATKQANRLKSSVEEIRQGVNAVTVAPTARAAEKQDKMLNNLSEAVNSGKWGRRLRAVTLDDWKTAMINKGINRIAGGIDAAHDKVVSFFDELFPYQETLQRTINQMSDLTFEDSLARMTAWARGMKDFQRRS